MAEAEPTSSFCFSVKGRQRVCVGLMWYWLVVAGGGGGGTGWIGYILTSGLIFEEFIMHSF